MEETDFEKVERSAHDFGKQADIIGKLKGTVKGNFEHDDYILDVDGKDVKVFGKTALQSKMEGIKDGDIIKIVFLGEKKSEKTGRVYQDFDVYKKK